MENQNKTQISKDFKEKSILVSRRFNAPLANVWRAYTESELLAQWWAPLPWKAETKVMDFNVGGSHGGRSSIPVNSFRRFNKIW